MSNDEQQHGRTHQWNWILSVVGGGTGIVLMAAWGVLMLQSAPNTVAEILTTGITIIVPYGIFAAVLIYLHRRKTASGDADA